MVRVNRKRTCFGYYKVKKEVKYIFGENKMRDILIRHASQNLVEDATEIHVSIVDAHVTIVSTSFIE